MSATVGVVLAGGESRRMEQPKALLTLPNGMSLIEHALEPLADLLLDDKSRLHAYHIRDSIVPLPIYVPQAAQGSLGAIIAGNNRSLRR